MRRSVCSVAGAAVLVLNGIGSDAAPGASSTPPARPLCSAQPLPLQYFNDAGRRITVGAFPGAYTGSTKVVQSAERDAAGTRSGSLARSSPLPSSPARNPYSASPPPDAPQPILADAPRVSLRLFVARDQQQRERGLMCITAMEHHVGMIFVFPADQPQNFWMKDTLIPLDMIFVAPDGTVRSIAADVPASTVRTPDERVAKRTGTGQYVIELNAGEARADGIVHGTRLRLPRLHAEE